MWKVKPSNQRSVALHVSRCKNLKTTYDYENSEGFAAIVMTGSLPLSTVVLMYPATRGFAFIKTLTRAILQQRILPSEKEGQSAFERSSCVYGVCEL